MDPKLTRAIEVFVQGFGFTRSFTHPYLGTKVGPLWVLRDAPRKLDKDYRNEEWSAYGTAPDEVDRIIRQHTRGRFCVCAFLPFGESDQSMREAYKAMGYRFKVGEPVMVHALKRIPRAKSPAMIQRVRTTELADAVTRAAGSRQILPEHLGADAPLRQYAALIEGKVVGWVRSIVCQQGTWCSNMMVLPKYRRRGIASALLAQLLRDDRKHGVKAAVLTASHAGAKLYTTLGYQQIATLLLFMPKR
ncbi:MAG: GNAT family N-acetyltransferase [Cephaloticoccus sp.]|nr:GNAT family N-acetyltransferase [Cephaloticoccus sp.]MCF7759014.1 GNAT family N-acetyltransferase [Cephaloticoccus sp.]